MLLANHMRAITWLEPSEATKVIGVQQAVDGNMEAQLLALKENL
jgi:hypothetical protein